MARVLILFAHPVLEKSRVQFELLTQAATVQGITINDLYQAYPDFDIDIQREKELLLSHDIIVWQHPFYWYSSPALLKQWQDLVLEHGWAYGKKGTALQGKRVFNAITSGGGVQAYREGGFNKYAINDYLRPFERTAELCHMLYWPPFWVPGVHRMEAEQIQLFGMQYKNILTALSKDLFSEKEIMDSAILNDLIPFNSIQR
jgi:glutathione-regulated potassium-efflux system ancillary protein KefG